jgi:hypothetical protein
MQFFTSDHPDPGLRVPFSRFMCMVGFTRDKAIGAQCMLFRRGFKMQESMVNNTRFIVIGLLFTALTTFTAMAQDQGARNAAWAIADGKIVITYDLVVPDDAEYEVTVILRRESDPAFRVLPVSITGDAGKNTKAGTRKTVIWDFRKDMASPLSGMDYYFEFSIVAQDRSSTSWWWYAAGGTVAVGVAAAVLLKGADATPPVVAATALPDPPRVRPTN